MPHRSTRAARGWFPTGDAASSTPHGCLPAKCPRRDGVVSHYRALGQHEPHRPRLRPLRQFLPDTENRCVVESSPGTDATRTATINNCAHSLVEFGQRPDTTNPLRAPRDWKGLPQRDALRCSPSRLRGVHDMRHDSGLEPAAKMPKVCNWRSYLGMSAGKNSLPTTAAKNTKMMKS